jgi:hypothetical protein
MDDPRGLHIVTFGAVVLMVAGSLNLLDGIVALANPDYLEDDLLVGSLTAWGWVVIAFGIFQLLMGAAVLLGSYIALWPGIVLAAINAVAQIANAAQHPLWSMAIVVADGLVIYGFTARAMRLGVETVEPERGAERMRVS